MQLSIIPLLIAILSAPSMALPEVHKEIYKIFDEGKTEGPILVTFHSADLQAAHDPDYMLKFASLKKKVMDIPINQFISTGRYHEIRGDYVHTMIDEHHQKTRDLLKKMLPKVQIASSIPISNSFLLIATREELQELAKSKDVVEIHTNESFQIELPTVNLEVILTDKDLKIPGRLVALNTHSRKKQQHLNQWNISKIGADKVWEMGGNSRGEKIIYAIADTGVSYTHPNIKGNYLGNQQDGTFNHNYAWFDGVRRPVAVDGHPKCGFAAGAPCDDQGHGTHVTSTAVGAAGYGVAPGAKWMACRNMDRGVGSPETYLNCLNFFLAPHDLDGNNPDPTRRPHVVGNSYGCPDSEGCSKNAMKSATEALRAAGIFMSVSAGNEGPLCSTIADPPALEPSVVSVGATDRNDLLAPFSSRGPCRVGGKTYRKPDVSAPGVQILAAYPGDGFRALSGTSMASPHVGGSAVLICALCPNICRDVDKMQNLLESTAIPLYPARGSHLCGGDDGKSVPNNHFGYGRIDILAAIRKCSA